MQNVINAGKQVEPKAREDQVAADKPAGVVAKGANVTKAQILKPAKGQDIRQVMAKLQAEVLSLQSALEAAKGGKEQAVPVSDEKLAGAIAGILADFKTSPFTASRSLKSKLGVIPALTDEQKKSWNVAKKETERLANSAARNGWEKIQSTVRRAKNSKTALLGFRERVRKTDNVQTGFTLSAKKMAMPIKGVKGKGKNGAKPEQPAKGLPKAGNADKPAHM